MAVAFDALTESADFTADTTFSHTPVGTPKGAIVLIGQNGATDEQIDSVTYGGVALARPTDARGTDTNVELMAAEAWFVGSGIPTGTQTVAINETGGTLKHAWCITVTAAADTAVEDAGNAGENQDDPLITLVTGAGVETYVAALLMSGLGVVTDVDAGTGYTLLDQHDFGQQVGSVQDIDTNDAGGNVDVQFLTFAADDVAMVALAIKEVAGGGATALTAAGAIASAEAFGTPLIRFIARVLGISSAEAHGTPNVRDILQPAGIAAAEAHGEPRLNLVVRPLGVATAESYGEPKLVRWVRQAGGIPSSEALGQPTLGITLIFSVGGIASGEAFGEPRLTRILHPAGIISAEAFGTASLLRAIRQAGGIASQEAVGEARVLRVVSPAGIASADVVSEPKLVRLIYPISIASLEAFGVTTVGDFVAPAEGSYGQALVSDDARYGVLVSDGELYLVQVSDAERFGARVSDRPGG